MTLQKKQNEITSLQRICNSQLSKRSLSGKIAKILVAQQDIRLDDKEAPDFVFHCLLPVEGECICGIEHFTVEQISDTHRKIPQSQVQLMHKRTIPNILKQTQDLAQSDPMPQNALDGIADYMRRAYDNTYADLMHSFNHSLQHHIQRVASYQQCLDSYANGIPTSLMFLIDVGMMPHGLWLFHDGGFTQYNNQPVIFSDMVKQIQQLSQYDVKYVLLDMHNSIDISKHYSTIIRTQHARKDLRNNGFIICDYFGEDVDTITKLNQILPPYSSSVQLKQTNDDTLTLQAQLSLVRSNDETEYHRNIIKALHAITHQGTFLTTTAIYLQVVMMLLCFEPEEAQSGLWRLSEKTYNDREAEVYKSLLKTQIVQ